LFSGYGMGRYKTFLEISLRGKGFVLNMQRRYDRIECMQIIWKGQACFSIIVQRNKQEQIKIVIDPFDPTFVGLKMPTLEADIVLVTHDHADHNYVKSIKGTALLAGKEPFVISQPGEYEVKDVFIKGISSFHDDAQGKERGQNTIYVMDAEGMRICHMGDFGQHELTPEQVGQIGNIDILLIGVGGTYTVEGKQAAKIVSQIEPRMVIPMHYGIPGLKIKLASAEDFLSAMGVKGEEAQAKLVIKSRDLPSEEAKVILLKPS
jgi:L-ascorbate metabolism protein UlaG (beta-lactamase superfamily)